jgi:hypothetical protein
MRGGSRAVLKAVLTIVLFLPGCSGKAADPGKEEPGIVEYMTGSVQLDSYRKTRGKIEEINKASKERADWKD